MVYAKRPFGGPGQVLEYLGRYTHRVAISNNRLVGIDEATVQFRWKDYRNGNRSGVMSLDAAEFIRRFLLHVLPAGFQRIRHYGLLSNRQHATKFARCRSLLGAGGPLAGGERRDVRRHYEVVTGKEIDLCPACGRGRMRVLEEVARAAMPPGRQPTPDKGRPPDSS